jgi:hypothetical protein
MSSFTNFMAKVDPTDHPAEAAIFSAVPVVGGILTAGLDTMGSIGAAIKSKGAVGAQTGGVQTVPTSNNNTIIVVVGTLGIGILAYFALR